MRVRRSLVAGGLVALAVWGGGVSVAASASRYVGRPLVEVLREMEAEGLVLLYSSDLVHPEMTVRREPAATSIEGILEELLGPHGLRPQIGPRGRVLIVRRDPTPVVVRISNPTERQAVFGEVEVEVEVVADEPIDAVVLEIDGRRAATMTEPPYTATVDVGEENVDRRFAVRAIGAWGGEGTASVTTRQVAFMENVEVALKQLYVTVSRNGRPVTGLREGDFSLWDDGVEQELVTFAGGDVPLTAILLLDVSESMKGRYLETVLEGSEAFLSRMQELDRTMVLLFSDRTLAITPFATHRESALDEIEVSSGAGGTALNDHLYAGLRLLDEQQGRRVVVLLSDGADVSSALRMRRVLWKVRRSDAMIYWIRLLEQGLDNYSSAWRNAAENERERQQLHEAVEESGGKIVELADIEEVDAAFDEIINELRSQYVLGYYPVRRMDGSWREVRVFLDRVRGDVRLRRGYVDQ